MLIALSVRLCLFLVSWEINFNWKYLIWVSLSQRKSSPNREVVGSNPKWRSSTLAIIDIVPPQL